MSWYDLRFKKNRLRKSNARLTNGKPGFDNNDLEAQPKDAVNSSPAKKHEISRFLGEFEQRRC